MSITFKACAALGIGALLTLSACTKDNPAPDPFATQGQGSPTPTATTPGADPTSVEQKKIFSALDKYASYLVIGSSKENALKESFDYSPVATGEKLSKLNQVHFERSLLDNYLEGKVKLEGYSLNSLDLAASKQKAEVSACLREDTVLMNVRGGKIQINKSNNPYLYLLIKNSGNWLVYSVKDAEGACE